MKGRSSRRREDEEGEMRERWGIRHYALSLRPVKFRKCAIFHCATMSIIVVMVLLLIIFIILNT